MLQVIIPTMRHGAAIVPRLAFAVAWRLLTAAIPLNAAELPFDPPRETPLEIAQKLESLTAGGLFNPVSGTPFIPQQGSVPEDDDTLLAPSIVRESW